MQELIVFLIFLIALTYLGFRAYRSFFAKKKSACGKGCGCEVDMNQKKLVAEKNG